MIRRFQSECAKRGCFLASRAALRGFAAMALFVLVLPGLARAQESQVVVGNVEGSDVSVSSATGPISPGVMGTTPVTNGAIVTVRSGQARLMLTSGGEIDACGPAKLTLLRSGDAITLALDFGRVRVQLPASTNLRIFTPTIIATPLDINGAPRDVTAELETDDSLCVRASSGALLLENQFSGEKLVVPQAGEFFLAHGQLAPVARPDATCECVMNEAHATPPSSPLPSLGLSAPALETPAANAPATPAPDPEDAPAKPNVEFSTLAHPNQTHPISPAPKPDAPVPPPEGTPTYKIVMPPLSFSASSPAPPPEPALNMVLLIRTVEVEPNWEFKGHVDSPPMEDKPKVRDAARNSHGKQPKPEGQQPGFWSKVKRFFAGGKNS
jgi:hypothetical protein